MPRSFRHDAGFAWIADLPRELEGGTDTDAAPYRSRLRLVENGRELGPAHAVHDAIRDTGNGGYSFWNKEIYFSTSDGSDPNSNGRTYTVEQGGAPPGGPALILSIRPRQTGLTWSAPERPLKCAILGLGNRGQALARLIGKFPGIELGWICDLSEQRINELHRHFDNAPGIRETTDYMLPFRDDTVDAVFVTLPDHLHRVATEAAFRAGKHVFLEKPVATNMEDARTILAAWQASGCVLQLGYVLRSAPFYQAVRNVVRRGLLGPIRVVDLSEQLSVAHGASFMRRWHADAAHSGGLLVHKSCHDLDLVCWLLDTVPKIVTSIGGTNTFRRPPPAAYCSQCGERTSCPYVDTGLHEKRSAPERADPTAFGLDRCVFGLNKGIVDNQIVSFEMRNGVRGSYYLAMQGPRRSERRITIVGDEGRLDGIFEDARFTLTLVNSAGEPATWSENRRKLAGHGGGDLSTVTLFLNACAGRIASPIGRVSDALAGLAFAIAAERARANRTVEILDDADFQLE